MKWTCFFVIDNDHWEKLHWKLFLFWSRKDLSYGKLRNLEKYWNIRKYYCVDLARCVWLMASWEILKNIETLKNIPALISHKMCLTDGKLRCAIKIGSDSITELVPMHSRVRKMESQCDNCKYICQIQIRLFITKHALEFAKNGKPKWLSPLP